MAKPLYTVDTDFNEDWLSNPEDTARPEKNLLVAMLVRGIADALFSTGRCIESERYSREAYSWIVHVSFKKTPKVFSFQWVCENLGLDARRIRRHIIERRKREFRLYRISGKSGHIKIRAA